MVQDVFTAAFSGLGRLEDPQAFAKWLYAIATRLCCKHVRRKKLLRRLGLDGGGRPVDIEGVAGRAAPQDLVLEARAIHEALDRLPIEERAALVLRRLEGLSLADVASMLGVSLATAKRRIANAEALLALATAEATR